MSAFFVRKEHVLNVLGIGDETPDETVVSTIDVRLDDMFREALTGQPNVVLVRAEDFDKIVARAAAWRPSLRTIQTRKIIFTLEEGLSDQHMRELNLAPQMMAAKVSGMGGLAFCHSPMFSFNRSRKSCELQVWLKAIVMPFSPGETDEPVSVADAGDQPEL